MTNIPTVDGHALLLAVDSEALPLRQRLCHYLSKPRVRLEPVLTPSRGERNAPDFLAAHFYGAVLQDQGMFRMWYYPCSLDCDAAGIEEESTLAWLEKHITQGPVCYAESDDGITWRKPRLHQVEFRGSKANNALALLPERLEGVNVIKDEEDPEPSRRYKMVFNWLHPKHNYYTLRTAVSGDGLAWQVDAQPPIAGFAEQASFYKHDGLYIVSTQVLSPFIRSEGGHATGRQGICFISPDFVHWLPECGESMILPEPQNPADRGAAKPYDQVHLGVGAASLGSVAVGLYCLWHNAPKKDDWFGLGSTSGELVLVTSRDGISFREPVPRHVYISPQDSPVTPTKGTPYATVLCQANGILNVGRETRIYHGRWRNAIYPLDYWGETALATLDRDRWGALGLFPDAQDGSAWSAPVTLPAEAKITLNADHPALVSVELADARFGLIPGFSGTSAGQGQGASDLDCPVSWPGGRGPEALAGKTVRLHVQLKKQGEAQPRLYALDVRGKRG